MKVSEIIKDSNNNFGVVKIIRDESFDTLGLASAEVDLKFCTFIEDEKYIKSISPNVSMVITNYKIAEKIKDKGVCISSEPRISFFKLHNYLSNKNDYIKQQQFKTKIGKDCNISPLANIAEKNVIIGDNVIIEEFVSIKENTIIRENSIIRAGAIIGGQGFEFKRLKDKKIMSVDHVGWTTIGKSVEIKYNACIDKAIYPWDNTIIEDNCKISNLVQISHGVKLGKGVFVTAGSVISGRTIIKDDTWVGIGAVISNGLVIGENSRVNIGSIATIDVEDGASVTGNFAIDHKKFIKFIKSIR